MITLEMSVLRAEKYAEALRTVLENCDVHVDEAVELDDLATRLEFWVEKAHDHATDVEGLY